MTVTAQPDTNDDALRSSPSRQAGHRERFGKRWRLVGAGLFNVWRFGKLDLPASSGRLLLRGPNGTGKTTALEALWPFLLDLNSTRLAAGKARSTTLSSLMREGSPGKRRYGYAWLSFAGPESEGTWSFGARLQYSEGGAPPVRVVPFTIPGRPLHDLPLEHASRAPLTSDEFQRAVSQLGGQVFEDEEQYVAHLAARLLGASSKELLDLAACVRDVRNPALLGLVSPDAAAVALRESLPGVDENVIAATAEALAESDATREAFERDKEAAESLEEFSALWSGHVVEAVRSAHAAATTASRVASDLKREEKSLSLRLAEARTATATTKKARDDFEDERNRLTGEIRGLEHSKIWDEAGRRSELQETHRAQTEAAGAAARAAREMAASSVLQSTGLMQRLDELQQDVEACAARALAADPTVGALARPFAWTKIARRPLVIGTETVTTGSLITIHGGGEVLREAAAAWDKNAAKHAADADAAAVALADYKPVDRALQLAEKAERAAGEAARTSDDLIQRRDRAASDAAIEATALLTAMSAWTKQNLSLAAAFESGTSATTDGITTDQHDWTLDDIQDFATAEPERVLLFADESATHAQACAERMSSDLFSRAKEALAQADELTSLAAELRLRAQEYRSGKLVALPRPSWAGPGDDAQALGGALDWSDAVSDPGERALLEGALAASGLLGATLTADQAHTNTWTVAATGAPVSPSLGDVLVVDDAHEWADTARAVLARIRLAETANASPDSPDVSDFVIGRDGTFSMGVLTGRPPGIAQPSTLPPATHVGARQRLEAARAMAAQLEREADEASEEAARLSEEGSMLRSRAKALVAAGKMFPARQALRSLEAKRAQLAGMAIQAEAAAGKSRTEAERLRSEATSARGEWAQRTRDRGLPPDTERLRFLSENGKRISERLRELATEFTGKLARRLDGAIATLARMASIDDDLTTAEAEAQSAHRTAAQTDAELKGIAESSGAAIEEVLAKHGALKQRLRKVEEAIPKAQQSLLDAAQAEAKMQTELDGLAGQRSDAEEKAAGTMQALRLLVLQPGVADAVANGAALDEGGGLLPQLDAMLAGKKAVSKKAVREKYDLIRARLAGVWSIDPGEDHPELLSYVLTHRDTSYSPTAAAAKAAALRDDAQAALAAADEKALQEFVIGRLPSAIGHAWTLLHDWKTDVNRKMRQAAASSGVGVQVDIALREDKDLPADTLVAYRLACKVSDAERSVEEGRQVGTALKALIDAAGGDTMHERVAAAVDIRDWVNVHYEVTRPGGKKQRWTSKTGLSTGERRLVVLAPMLAAVAAAHDQFNETALRIVALDEIPAEVDERGREGLARYIAELDLDLVCTSYLWDGSPGAWDGIDAHDLEAAPDGMVVAFPMLIRGLDPIPDDVERPSERVERAALGGERGAPNE